MTEEFCEEGCDKESIEFDGKGWIAVYGDTLHNYGKCKKCKREVFIKSVQTIDEGLFDAETERNI